MQSIQFLLFSLLLLLNVLALNHFIKPVQPLELLLTRHRFLHGDDAWRDVVHVVQVLDQVVFDFVGFVVNSSAGELSYVLFYHVTYVLIQFLGALNFLIEACAQFIIGFSSKILDLPVLSVPVALFHYVVTVNKQ